MADILSQEEVDALLAAVSEAEPLQAERPEPPAKRYHVARYDFKRPERVSKEQFRGFQTLSELFARELSTALGGSLRVIARAVVASVDQITYEEYILSVSNPTSYNIIQLPPLEGNLILEFNPSLIFPIIDRLLGGRGMAISKARELTEIEQKLVAKIIDLVLGTLVRAWRHLAGFSWKLIAQENDPQIVQIVTGSEIVLVLRFELSVGEITGAMSLCMPVLAIEPMLEKVGAEYTFYGAKPDQKGAQTAAAVKDIVFRASTSVEAYLSGSSIYVHDLLNLQVGDIIRLDNSTADESCITICVGGKQKFKAKQGRIGSRQAFQIVTRIQ
ncbi:MAG: flagellar motor switch protein FliM [Candidatus Abyssobacteria bacterium SURF_5]|uniref:Flagellar motor switch protein FliM n=1 Tax=Abyssobacteria bacterium (strain SURF_5) TaxID=2093360 RepID=A0A3A4NTX7_ABYX5|nr:MAG: flagellar motor switch protein FliM [Candidatus Abyssubacteria bacterium SURF_5]